MKKCIVIFLVISSVVGMIVAKNSRTTIDPDKCNECCEHFRDAACYIVEGDKVLTCNRGYNMCDQEPPKED